MTLTPDPPERVAEYRYKPRVDFFAVSALEVCQQEQQAEAHAIAAHVRRDPSTYEPGIEDC